MVKECEKCVYKSEFKSVECGSCMVSYYDGEQQGLPSNFKQKPMTNADRIRAMSDEELAHELAMVAGWDRKQYQKAQRIGIEKVMLDYLQQPAEEEHENG